jgi:hypothetical protein
MAILTKGNTYSSGQSVTATNLNALVDSATFKTGNGEAVDGSTLQVHASGYLMVKDGGITSTKLAAGAVDASAIGTGTITDTQLASDAVTTIKIADDAVTADKLAHTAVTPGSYTNTNLTVDQQGRITAAASSSGLVGTAQVIVAAPTSSPYYTNLIAGADTLLGSLSLTDINISGSAQSLYFNLNSAISGVANPTSAGYEFFSPSGSTSWYLVNGFAETPSTASEGFMWDGSEINRAGKAYLANTYYNITTSYTTNTLQVKFVQVGNNQLDFYLKRTGVNNSYYGAFSAVGKVF